jgi:hypothetical protein
MRGLPSAVLAIEISDSQTRLLFDTFTNIYPPLSGIEPLVMNHTSTKHPWFVDSRRWRAELQHIVGTVYDGLLVSPLTP